MPTEEGVVEKIVKDKAVVRIQKSSACAHCESRGACQVLSDREVRVEVRNDLEAGVGDCVQLSVPAGSMIKLSMLIYLFPVVALIVGAYAGGAWAESFRMDSTLASIVGGGIAMGITYFVLKWFDRRSAMKDEYQPRMMRFLSQDASRQVEEEA